MSKDHILYIGRVAGDDPKPGQVLEVRCTREHSGFFVFVVRFGVRQCMECVGFFQDQSQAIEEAVNMAQDQRAHMMASDARRAVPA
jgi:hypothetical protein